MIYVVYYFVTMNWLKLPFECWESILVCLAVTDIVSLSKTCKSLHCMVEGSFIWKKLVTQHEKGRFYPLEDCPSHFSYKDWYGYVTSQPVVIRYMYRALYNFITDRLDEITFYEGDILFLANESPCDSGWWYCYNHRTEKSGLLPAEYVETIGSDLDATEYPQFITNLPLSCFSFTKHKIIRKKQREGCEGKIMTKHEYIEHHYSPLDEFYLGKQAMCLLENKIWLFEDFLSLNECQEFISLIESMEIRNHRNMFCPRLADMIFNRLKKLLRQPYTVRDDIPLETSVGVNSCVRFCKFETGESLPLHTDAVAKVDDNEKMSHCSVVIYLNGKYEGGRTIFLDNSKEIICEPHTGTCILFDQAIPHWGSKILYGGPKYILRTDLLFKR